MHAHSNNASHSSRFKEKIAPKIAGADAFEMVASSNEALLLVEAGRL
jgi:hypothetical protein